MPADRNIPWLLFVSVLVIRPLVSGTAYHFAQTLLLVPVLLAFSLLLLRDREPGLKHTAPVQLSLLAILVWAALSLRWSSDAGEGVRELLTLTLNALTFLVAALLVKGDVPERGYSRHAAYLLFIIVCPTLLWAVYQRFFGLELLRQALLEMSAAGVNVAGLSGVIRSGRVFAGFLNPNMLAGFIAMAIPPTLAGAVTAGNRAVRIFSYSFLSLEAWVLVMTRSIGGTGAAFAGVALFLVFRGSRNRRLSGRIVAGGAFILLLVLALRRHGIAAASENSIFQRFGYMASGIKMAMKHPLAGWGSGASPGGLMGFVNPGLRPVVDPHNFLIRAWISWGAIGTVILAIFLALWCAKMVSYHKINPRMETGNSFHDERSIYLYAFTASAAVFLLHSLVDMDFFVPEVSLFGWVCLGLAYGMACDPGGHAEGHIYAKDMVGRGAGTGAPRLVWGAVSLLLVLPSLYVSQAEFLGYLGQKTAENGQFGQASDYYKRASIYLPFYGSFAMGEGDALLRSGDAVAAEKRFESAAGLMKTSPYPQWELAKLAASAGDWASAVDHLQSALDRYPSSGSIRLDLASAIIRAGDPARGILMLRTVPENSRFEPRTRELAESLLKRLENRDPRED